MCIRDRQEAIRMNPVNRCYLCKKHLFVNLKEMAKSLGAETVMDGTNEDDHQMCIRDSSQKCFKNEQLERR